MSIEDRSKDASNLFDVRVNCLFRLPEHSSVSMLQPAQLHAHRVDIPVRSSLVADRGILEKAASALRSYQVSHARYEGDAMAWRAITASSMS